MKEIAILPILRLNTKRLLNSRRKEDSSRKQYQHERCLECWEKELLYNMNRLAKARAF